MNWYKRSGAIEYFKRLYNKLRGELIGGQQYKGTVGPGLDPFSLPSAERVISEDPKISEKLTNEFYKAERLANEGKYEEATKILLDIAPRSHITGLKSLTYKEDIKKQDALKIFLDVDNLKWMNEIRLGHEGADIALNQVAQLLKNAFGKIKGAVAYHPHGDEMGVVIDMKGLNEEESKNIINEAISTVKYVTNEIPKYLILNPSNMQQGARPTVTAGISFDMNLADELVTHEKHRRSLKKVPGENRKWLSYKPQFVIIAPDVQTFLSKKAAPQPPQGAAIT